MKCSIGLSPEQRSTLLDRYRKDPDPEVRFRSHILLLADGYNLGRRRHAAFLQ